LDLVGAWNLLEAGPRQVLGTTLGATTSNGSALAPTPAYANADGKVVVLARGPRVRRPWRAPSGPARTPPCAQPTGPGA